MAKNFEISQKCDFSKNSNFWRKMCIGIIHLRKSTENWFLNWSWNLPICSHREVWWGDCSGTPIETGHWNGCQIKSAQRVTTGIKLNGTCLLKFARNWQRLNAKAESDSSHRQYSVGILACRSAMEIQTTMVN